jgi:hypothetical protein
LSFEFGLAQLIFAAKHPNFENRKFLISFLPENSLCFIGIFSLLVSLFSAINLSSSHFFSEPNALVASVNIGNQVNITGSFLSVSTLLDRVDEGLKANLSIAAKPKAEDLQSLSDSLATTGFETHMEAFKDLPSLLSPVANLIVLKNDFQEFINSCHETQRIRITYLVCVSSGIRSFASLPEFASFVALACHRVTKVDGHP